MKIPHTPGPWFVVTDHSAAQVKGFPLIHSHSGYSVVGVEGMYGDLDTDFANAYLIAAAPDVLAALEEAADPISGYLYGTVLHRALAAIAKAKGQL